MKKRTKIILLSLGAVVMIGAILLGVFIYQNWKTEKTISEYQERISTIEKTFSDSEERSDKLEVLKQLINEANEYSQSEKPIKEIKQNYKQNIQSMKSYFVEMYDTEIEQNALSEEATITDKEELNSAKTNLSALLVTMESEQEVTLSEAEYTEYVEKINALIDEYTNRVAEVEKAEEEARLKAEEEAKEKAEQEAKEKAEAEKKASSSSNKSSNSTSNSSNSSSNNSNSSGLKEKYDSFEEVERLIKAGVITNWSWYTEDGWESYKVGHYVYCKNGDIIDLTSDPVFGFEYVYGDE